MICYRQLLIDPGIEGMKILTMGNNANQYIDMIKYINSHDTDDSYSRIILYILHNKERIETISITDLSEICFISNATISRFSKHFGYASFSDLKKAFSYSNKIEPEYVFRLANMSIKTLKDSPLEFLTNYKNNIIASLDDLIENLDLDQLDFLLNCIHESNSVFLFGAESSLFLLREIQCGLLLSDKVVYSGETIEDFARLAEKLTKDSVVLIISSFGNFLSENPSLINTIKNSHCKIFFITQHTETMISASFEQSILLTKQNHIKAGSYPLFLYSEFLVRRYYALFKND